MNLSTVTAITATDNVRVDSNTTNTSSQSDDISQSGSFGQLLSSHLSDENSSTSQSNASDQQVSAPATQKQSQPVKQTAGEKAVSSIEKNVKQSAAQTGDTSADTASESTVNTASQLSLNALLLQSHESHSKSVTGKGAASAEKTDKDSANSDISALSTTKADTTMTDDTSTVSSDPNAVNNATLAIMAMLREDIPQQIQDTSVQTTTASTSDVASNVSTSLLTGVQLNSKAAKTTLDSLKEQESKLSDESSTSLQADTVSNVSETAFSKINTKGSATVLKHDSIEKTMVSKNIQGSVQQGSDGTTLSSSLNTVKETSTTTSSTGNSTATNTLVSNIQQAMNSGSTTATPALTSSVLNAQVGTDAWQQALSQQIVMFARNNQQSVELRLHPQELGTIQVSMTLDDNQAQIHLASAHGQVRAALEAALPHLKTALSDSGITLNQSSIGSEAYTGSGWQQNGQSNGESSSTQRYVSSAESAREVLDVPPVLQRMASSINGVDTFA
ncbi:flagellar hook-length control protein FliK [Pectobacteriaceae bacterium CE70]|nr:flagellar hook-length control protein FliK [Pectobacteriaceae bacterium CE70]WJY12542.1 flagellar hook-length control protein FliK [Pectobacteriaceae bacterium C80]